MFGVRISVDPKRMLSGLSLCLDFVEEGLRRHHQRVAFIGLGIAGEMGLSSEEQDDILLAALVHDIGITTLGARAELHNKCDAGDAWTHCQAGCELLRQVRLLSPVAPIVLSHHDRFAGPNRSGLSGEDIPLPARIIHLACKVDTSLRYDRHVLLQVEDVVSSAKAHAGEDFDPAVVAAFLRLARKESFWLELANPFRLDKGLGNACVVPEIGLDESDMRQVAWLFADLTDRKSRFTYHHSRHVAAVAVVLASAMDWAKDDLVLVELAGITHDLGKLSIPDGILEKPGRLTAEEFALIRQHPYYTYTILSESAAPAPLPEWAAYHHERLDGNGYPFHLDAFNLDTGSRIMAVADVFAALREDRPYRRGMGRSQLERVIRNMVVSSALDGEIVGILFDVYEAVDRAVATEEDPGASPGESHVGQGGMPEVTTGTS